MYWSDVIDWGWRQKQGPVKKMPERCNCSTPSTMAIRRWLLRPQGAGRRSSPTMLWKKYCVPTTSLSSRTPDSGKDFHASCVKSGASGMSLRRKLSSTRSTTRWRQGSARSNQHSAFCFFLVHISNPHAITNSHTSN